MTLSELSELIADIGVIAGVIIPVVIIAVRIINAVKCLLRSKMLQIYYKHLDTGKIRQYEFENFTMLYKAYKALWGNSFIEKIHDEVREWEVIS